MKRYIAVVLMLCLTLMFGGCKEKSKEFVAGDNELILLTSTPKGGVETYEIYTTNIMIYVDGTVKIYASDFVRWFGAEDIPEMTLQLTPEEIEEIKGLIIAEDLYNLREDVGNKDGISGTVKYMTIYSANGTNKTGGISVSNRQFVRAYDRIENLVREELYIYTNEIDETQYTGHINFNNRNIAIQDRAGNTILDNEYVNDVYAYSEETTEGMKYYTVIEYNDYGGEILTKATMGANSESPVVLSLHINNYFETSVAVYETPYENKLYILQNTQEDANQLTEKIKTGLK